MPFIRGAVAAFIVVGLCIPAARALQPTDPVKINEVNYDPPESPEDPFEFIELFNAGAFTVFLDAAVITDEGNNGTGEAAFQFPGVLGGTTIALPPGGRMLLVGDATGSTYSNIAFEFFAGGTDTDDLLVPNLVKTSGTGVDLQLANTGDGVTLSTGLSNGNIIPCNEIVDGVSWESGGTGDVTALSSSVCNDAGPHPGYANTTESLQRIPDGTDTNTTSASDFTVFQRTPGTENGVSFSVPPDFHLLAASGGLTPWENIYRVEIDSVGNGDFRYAEPADRDADTWTLVSSFSVSPPDLQDLWNSIQSEGFFALPSASFDPTRHDGWFADLVVRANAITHRVKVQNFTLPQFNNLALKINEKTPPDNDLIYNDIHQP